MIQFFESFPSVFSDGYHAEWANFYNQGYPASSQHRHIFWHVKYRKTMAPHQDHWYTNTDDQLMEEYIARHIDEFPLQELEEIKNSCEYSCSDPRLPPRQQEHSEQAATEAGRRFEDEFKSWTAVLECYVEDHKNLGAHLFMNCKAGSLYPHRALLEEARFTTCFNDYHDLMVAARLGKDGYVRQIAGYNTGEDDTRVRYVSWAIFEAFWGKTKHRDTEIQEPLTRARMNMSRVCVCVSITSDRSMSQILHTLQVRALRALPSSVPVIKLTRLQATGTSHACYLATPKAGGAPRTNATFCSTGSTR